MHGLVVSKRYRQDRLYFDKVQFGRQLEITKPKIAISTQGIGSWKQWIQQLSRVAVGNGIVFSVQKA